MREKVYVGTVVIVETGVTCGMQLFVKSNASAVKTVETGLRQVAGGNFFQKRIKRKKINTSRHDIYILSEGN